MKTIYFVRHGESEANVGFPVYQGEATKLTEKGKGQARFIASRCEKIEFDAFFASTAVRARETAQFIAEATGKEFEVNGVFTERKQPQELLGRLRADPDARAMEAEWMKSFLDDGARVGSGEDFAGLKARGLEALDFLLARREERILVVSHGFFLHMIIALVIFGDAMTIEEFKRVACSVWMDNTGITRIEHHDGKSKRVSGEFYRGWVLRVWNDHAHLG